MVTIVTCGHIVTFGLACNLVNFVSAIANHLSLNLPAAFLQPRANHERATIQEFICWRTCPIIYIPILLNEYDYEHLAHEKCFSWIPGILGTVSFVE